MNPEIEELPAPPMLTTRSIKALTRLCFRQDSSSIPATDGIFIFGSSIFSDHLAEKVHELIEKKVANRVIITGGPVAYHSSVPSSIPQSEMIYQQLQKFSPLKIDVLLENTSKNTFENVQFGVSTLNGAAHSLCFMTKSFHCGRCYLTLRKFLPQTVLFQTSYAPLYPGDHQEINAENWFHFQNSKARVWGEFLRIRKYGQRGDLELGEVAGLISEIEESVDHLV